MKYKHFSIEEREILQRLRWERKTLRFIARELCRSPASISREIRRNSSPEKRLYQPRLAHERALQKRRSRGRTERLKSECVRRYVIEHLKSGWSPEQISGCIEADIHEHISHEAVYQFVYAQIHRDGYGLLKPGKEDLRIYLKRRHRRRQPKGMRRCRRVLKPYGRSIETRPNIVERRTRVGDFESDTVESVDHRPGINTLVERRTGLVFITKLADKTSMATRRAIKGRLADVPVSAKHTVTFDNGPENREWQTLEADAGITSYFAHPYHSWERGTNENTNGLIRWYFPKGTDFTTVSEAEIAAVEYALNTRPRKRLGWKTPLEVWSVALRS
jgi:transposase, IS30 family